MASTQTATALRRRKRARERALRYYRRNRAKINKQRREQYAADTKVVEREESDEGDE